MARAGGGRGLGRQARREVVRMRVRVGEGGLADEEVDIASDLRQARLRAGEAVEVGSVAPLAVAPPAIAPRPDA
jgi:hypothetical protein